MSASLGLKLKMPVPGVSEWESVSLEALVDPARPITYGIVQPGPDVPSGIPYVRVVDMQNGTVRTENLRRTSVEIARSYQRAALSEGDLLVSIRGHVGRTAFVPKAVHGANLTQDTARVAIIASVEPRFVRWFIESPQAKRWMTQHTKGVAVTGINLGDLRQLPVPLPPLPEQRRIASILDKADTIRRKRQEAIALTEQLLRSTFLEMFGDPVTNPKRWPTATLGDCVGDETCNGLSPSSKGEFSGRVLTLSAITRGPFDPSAVKEAMFDIEPPKEKMAGPDVFLVCRGNGNVGLVGAGKFGSMETAEILFPDTMIGLRVDASRFDRMFFERIWQSPLVRAQIESGARTTNGTFKINQKVLLAVRILEPPKELQQRFGCLAARIEQAPYRRASEEAETLFNSLVHRAFTAQL